MNNSAFTEILRDFISLIYPDYCLACDDSLAKGESLICTRCRTQMPQTNYHREVTNALRTRLSTRIQLRYAMALFRFSKSGRVQRLLHALKYKNQPELGVTLGLMYGERIATTLAGAFDLIIPVPLHSSRKRARGYNQSAKFAEGLSQSLGIFYSDEIIERVKKTETQTRKSKLNRWENIAEVFRVNDQEMVRDKNILLVDDVVTTGSTLEACGDHLLRAGCSSLSIACIAEA